MTQDDNYSHLLWKTLIGIVALIAILQLLEYYCSKRRKEEEEKTKEERETCANMLCSHVPVPVRGEIHWFPLPENAYNAEEMVTDEAIDAVMAYEKGGKCRYQFRPFEWTVPRTTFVDLESGIPMDPVNLRR